MYQVLYRKYRPKVFDDVVGQEHITSTLQNEIKTDKLSHAYLFTGSRGTGKTTCARILAKAINCLDPKDGNPCNECEVCRAIDSEATLDVTEIDAASNNSVDNIRDLRDEVNMAPALCRYRVYIIDEVHMLSMQAFNALLKTLEEPPPYVKFILATTEVQKLPVTILSRCQRFDFKRVSAESMKKRMDRIAELEGFSIDGEAASLVARLADGGMRDALSMLDRCVGRSENVTVDVVSAVAGLTGKTHLFGLADSVASRSPSKALSLINELYGNSFDMERLCSELIAHFRALMIAKTLKDPEAVLISTAEEIAEYKEQSSRFSLESLLLCIDTLQSALASIKQGVNRRAELELCFIKLCSPEISDDPSSLLRRIEALESALKSGTAVKHAVPEGSAAAPTERKPETAVDVKTPPAQDVSESGDDGELEEWPAVLERINRENKPLWSALAGTSAYVSGGVLVIRGENPAVLSAMIRRDKNNQAVLVASFNVTGRKIRRLAIDQKTSLPPASSDETEPEPKEHTKLETFIEKAKSLGIEVTEK